MKVLIVGSLRKGQKGEAGPDDQYVAANKEGFKAACAALGKALASRGHSIMIGVPDWPKLKGKDPDSVALFVAAGASKAPVRRGDQPHEVIFYCPQEHEPPDTTPDTVDSLAELKKLENIKLRVKYMGKGASKARTIPNITEVDCVLLIAGRTGTENIGYAAYSMEKPTIAITSFLGSAKDLAFDVLSDRYHQYAAVGGPTADDLSALDVDWKSDRETKAKDIVSVVEQLVHAHARAQEVTPNVLRGYVAGVAILLVAWIAMYLTAAGCAAAKSCGSYVNIAFFALLFASALMGTGLRTLVAYQENKIAAMTALGQGIDVSISLLLAFGLTLLYLIGSISFTGKVVVLTGGDDAFANVAISMSLLGLAAGYLVPLRVFAERLTSTVFPKKEEAKTAATSA